MVQNPAVISNFMNLERIRLRTDYKSDSLQIICAINRSVFARSIQIRNIFTSYVLLPLKKFYKL